MPEVPSVRSIVGHHAGWGLIGQRLRVTPYLLTPGATDTMRVRVREKIDIHGVGTDVVEMEGAFIVRRDHPFPVEGATAPEWGKSYVRTEFRSLELFGESPVFGTVRVSLDPDQVSHGEVGPAELGSQAGKCGADLYPVIELPDLGLKLSTGGQAISLASKVIQIPPVGDVARSESSAQLVDDSGNVIGELISSDVEVGDILFSLPLGSTGEAERLTERSRPAKGQPTPAVSGVGFFTRYPTTGQTKK
jgi:hypothetical protein